MLRFAIRVCVALLLFVPLPAFAGDLKIVCFGDSTTALRGTIKEVYSVRLPALFAPLGWKVTSINAGVGGSHTGHATDTPRYKQPHALDRIDQVRQHQADWVVVQFGINDSWIDSSEATEPPRISMEDYRANLIEIIHRFRQDGTQVLLMTPNRYRSEIPEWRLDDLSQYAWIVRQVARDWNVPLVDVWQAYAELGADADRLLLDGAHPNDSGHALVAKMIVEALKPRLEHSIKATKAATVLSNVPRGYSIPLVDLNDDTDRQIVVDREEGQYLGHPTTVLLEDGLTMIAVYPQGHGRGGIVMKRSSDAGLTWSDRLPVPENWSTSLEVPTIYRTIDATGTKRLVMFSGLYPIRSSISEDDGLTWTPLKPIGDYGGIVAMGCLYPVKTGPGHYRAMFHDDGRALHKDGTPTQTFRLFQVLSTDGGVTWREPEEIFQSDEVHLCEPGVIRSPDGKQLAVLLRENRRQKNSHVIFSDDEGRTWTAPREVPGSLTGDRHTAVYAPDGRLFISFRDTTLESPTKGDWVGWVGRYEDIVQGNEGQYRVRLKDNHKGADCAYPGVLLLTDGTIVTTTYGHWAPDEQPWILSVRFQLAELDARLPAAP